MKQRSTPARGTKQTTDAHRGRRRERRSVSDDSTSTARAPQPTASAGSPLRSSLLLAAATLACLLPFSGRAFNIDEPLFVWAARQISQHPLDPYGFSLNWCGKTDRFSAVSQNPPLSSYFGALVGSLAGWSERTFHLAFLLPALVAVLGTYWLARRLCRGPLLAAGAALLAPGFLVSAGTVMCDTMMLALWLLATALWIEGLDRRDPLRLAAAALLVAASALTKYFGVALIPLLLVYSLVRERRLGSWAWSFLIPIAVLAGYQWWTLSQYGHGMLLDAAAYARAERISTHAAPATKALVAIGFLGGCMLPALTLAPLLWSRRALLAGAVLAGFAAMAIATGWLDPKIRAPLQHPGAVGVELALCIAGGASALALAITDLWKHRNAESLLLALWVLGTVSFAGVFNWTVNARSILPAIPAVAILLARRLAARPGGAPPVRAERLAVPLAVAGAVALCVAWADYRLANDARREAWLVHERTSRLSGLVCFQGHWGFQYYLQPFGARPADAEKSELRPGDIVAVPQNNTNALGVRPEYIAARERVEVPTRAWITTMSLELGAGFYSDFWGPLPFAFGPVPPERCLLVRLKAPEASR